MAIAILPYRQPQTNFVTLADYRLADLLWPLEDRPSGETVADLGPCDHLVMYSSSRAFLARRSGLRCKLSILFQEPPAIQRRYYQLIRWIGARYHRILTHNSELLTSLQNARFVPHGGTFLKSVRTYETPKTRRISIVASKKTTTIGHQLRHRIASWSAENAPDLDLFGYGYNAVEDKSEAHAPYWFSVVVENSRCPGYFTEKLIDSLLCRSLPVYWGAPDVAHFFDPRGLICCHSEAELKEVIAALTPEEYQRRLAFLEDNVHRALGFADYHKNAAIVVADEVRPAQLHCRRTA